eukprot:CAMPEP_0206479976 /NCGR_PEP_ID=MMETSP0324_2-20121206/36981_1 /ASSEMBLY_ACC=CAM_ASM_000836 /TAXON_ID=2866 /ORGANISM="Crypthecodinium cohnii, Strain Seligo" /LENGTH=110 /DNA_ID=CAMNT_0053956599 /DNA_START=13 /DNA_END=342 /DNA_ORIENTATION=-
MALLSSVRVRENPCIEAARALAPVGAFHQFRSSPCSSSSSSSPTTKTSSSLSSSANTAAASASVRLGFAVRCYSGVAEAQLMMMVLQSSPSLASQWPRQDLPLTSTTTIP